jgi:hypothetical protein
LEHRSSWHNFLSSFSQSIFLGFSFFVFEKHVQKDGLRIKKKRKLNFQLLRSLHLHLFTLDYTAVVLFFAAVIKRMKRMKRPHAGS